MSVTRSARHCAWLLLLGLAVLAGPALAADAKMTLYVFKKGLPQPLIEVLVDGRVVSATDDKGVAVFDIEPGLRMLELRDQDLVVLDQQILATEGEVSQWIVNITSGLSSLVDVESSAAGAGLLATTADQPQATGDPGVLAGQLLSADDGKPIKGARIFISGQSSDIRSADDGRFEIELPSGSYSVSVLHASFNTLTRDGIEVPANGQADLQLELTPSGSELPEFVVIEPYIAGSLASVLEERRTELAVANILGAEQISKAGDSDAAGALKRVTGLTLVDGRFIYVRGLGERYSSTLLNGAGVPSPDPTRRVVPLDLFPTGIIDSIAVKKGYTSSLPGEFGGGTVEIRTRSIPQSSFLKLEVGLGYRDGTTGKSGLRYDGSSDDWTGSDGGSGSRAQPQALREAIADDTRLVPFNRFTGVGFQPEELEAIGESLTVNYDVYDEDIDANRDFTLSGGWVKEFDGGQKFGLLAAMDYADKWLTTEGTNTNFVNGGGGLLISQNDFRLKTTQRNIDRSFFFTSGFEFSPNNKLSYNWMQLRNTTDRAQREQGFNTDAVGGEVKFAELEWTEREMVANQFFGEHIFPAIGGLKLDWQYTLSDANAYEPDTRRYRFDPDRRTPETDDFIFSLRNDSNQRRWSDLDDSSDSWNVDFLQPLSAGDTVDVSLLFGLNRVEKSRDSEIRRFTFATRGPVSSNLELLRNSSLEDIIFDETIDPRGWQLEEITNATDSYTAEQTIKAWHLGFDMDFNGKFRASGGLRNESSDMDVTTFDQFDPDRNPQVTSLGTDDIFPFASFTWFKGDHQLRAGWGETINRPDFKELSPSQYRDPLLDRIVRGNQNLVPAFITHYDVRWDYYFNPGEFISFGVFFKQFDTPIEVVILASAGNDLLTFDNAESAENFGFEFEFFKNFSFLGNLWEREALWEKFYVNTNYAWIESDITLSDDDSTIQTTDSRPLQGQSPYVWNFQVGYDDLDREINAALLYNIFGERIVQVGVQGAPDIYEQPRPSLDFVYSQRFGDWRLRLKATNLLDPEIELTQGIEVPRSTQPIGREYSIGVEYTFY